jgi:hypothetical protein
MTEDERNLMDVEVYWNDNSNESHGSTSLFGGIEWVCEHQDRIVLVPADGSPEEPPRITIYRKDICAFHETDPELGNGDGDD